MKTLHKTLLLTLIAILAANFLFAKSKIAAADEQSSVQYIIHSYGVELDYTNVVEYPEHFLGDEIARKYHATENLYVPKAHAVMGFVDRTVQIVKPHIYKAVQKLDSFYKKALRKEEIEKEVAALQYSKILDIAYIACNDSETEEFEKALRKAKDYEQIVDVFNSVVIE